MLVMGRVGEAQAEKGMHACGHSHQHAGLGYVVLLIAWVVTHQSLGTALIPNELSGWLQHAEERSLLRLKQEACKACFLL